MRRRNADAVSRPLLSYASHIPTLRTHQIISSQRNMIQCPDAHLFCTECIIAYASNLLGEHNFKITCMDQSECGLPFSDSELERFLPPKLLSLYTRVKQTKEVDMAGLDGLEECPHCEFKAVIDDPGVKVFRCQNEECEAVTCRGCKRPVRSFLYGLGSWLTGGRP